MNTKKTSHTYFGIGLILFGSFFILRDSAILQFELDEMWPIFPSIVALLIWINLVLNPKKYELIMPASILTVYSTMFWSVIYVDQLYFSDLWPFFMMGPAIGFWLLLLSPYSEKNSLIPAVILTALTIIFLVDIHYHVNSQLLMGLAFVVIGLILMVNRKKKSSSSELMSD